MELHGRGRSAPGRARSAAHPSRADWSPQPARSGRPEDRIPQLAPRARRCSRGEAVKELPPPGRAGLTLFFKRAPREPGAVQKCAYLLSVDSFLRLRNEYCNIKPMLDAKIGMIQLRAGPQMLTDTFVPPNPPPSHHPSPLRVILCLV